MFSSPRLLLALLLRLLPGAPPPGYPAAVTVVAAASATDPPLTTTAMNEDWHAPVAEAAKNAFPSTTFTPTESLSVFSSYTPTISSDFPTDTHSPTGTHSPSHFPSTSFTPTESDFPTLAHPLCHRKIVYCLNGQAHSHEDFELPTGKTCTDECAGNCCVGEMACDSGRFAICADDGDGSCNGEEACYRVGGSGGAVGLISGHSCIGNRACYDVGYEGGAAGLITGGSCVGSCACIRVAYRGVIGDITDGSCNGKSACAHAAQIGGAIGNISGQSCVGKLACFWAADGGVIGAISNRSCLGHYACGHAARAVGTHLPTYYPPGAIGDIANSCQADRACEALGASNPGFQASLDSCCNIPNKCQYVGCRYVHWLLGSEYFGCPGVMTTLPRACLVEAPSDVPSKSPGPTDFVSKYWVVCGKGTGCGKGDEIEADADEVHEVRCCSDTYVLLMHEWWTKRDNCDVWTSSLDCYETSFSAAVDYCANAGARLCTRDELTNQCTNGSGCDFDGRLIWSSTPLSDAEAMVNPAKEAEAVPDEWEDMWVLKSGEEPRKSQLLCIHLISFLFYYST